MIESDCSGWGSPTGEVTFDLGTEKLAIQTSRETLFKQRKQQGQGPFSQLINGTKKEGHCARGRMSCVGAEPGSGEVVARGGGCCEMGSVSGRGWNLGGNGEGFGKPEDGVKQENKSDFNSTAGVFNK